MTGPKSTASGNCLLRERAQALIDAPDIHILTLTPERAAWFNHNSREAGHQLLAALNEVERLREALWQIVDERPIPEDIYDMARSALEGGDDSWRRWRKKP